MRVYLIAAEFMLLACQMQANRAMDLMSDKLLMGGRLRQTPPDRPAGWGSSRAGASKDEVFNMSEPFLRTVGLYPMAKTRRII
jgi:hypothetical protein